LLVSGAEGLRGIWRFGRPGSRVKVDFARPHGELIISPREPSQMRPITKGDGRHDPAENEERTAQHRRRVVVNPPRGLQQLAHVDAARPEF
jgi:hypothetical protein